MRSRAIRKIHRVAPASFLGFALSIAVVCGCRKEPEAALVTRVEALTPAAAPAPARIDSACEFVEREARKLGASLPRRLDEDTAATRVTARGCDLTIEYRLLTLVASEVTPNGLDAMQTEVAERLCADAAARATLERGGAFTNVYTDRAGAPIGTFSIEIGDCAEPSSALEQSRG